MPAVNFNQPSKGRVNSDDKALEVINEGNGMGVFVESFGDGAGVWSKSHGNQRAIVAEADILDGVFGLSHGNGSGVLGENFKDGAGVWGVSHGNQRAIVAEAIKSDGVFGLSHGDGAGVVGESKGAGAGVAAESQQGEGVHGETRSDRSAAVAGLQLNQNTDNNAIGVYGRSLRGEGVHGETSSDKFSAVVGIQLNQEPERGEWPAGVWGESRGRGAGIFGRGRLAGRFEGNVEVTGTLRAKIDVVCNGADCAEEFDISSTDVVEPGSVMVLNNTGNLEQSQQPYDKKVAGVVSGAGNYKPALILDKKESKNNRLPIALMGKVYCKVDATHSPIEIGDLLTTSPTEGHAMKAVDPLKVFGTVIGKALCALKEGRASIPILVALQ